MKLLSRWRSVCVLAIVLTVAACSVQRNPVTGNKHAFGYSWEKEQEIGKQADKQVRAQYGFYDNQDLQDYIDEVGQKVFENSDMRDKGTAKKYLNSDFHYHLLDNPVPNAFTTPGGYIYVDRGLLAMMENEAQLAMVIGHETGHGAARHSAQQAFNQKLGQFALLGGAVAGQAIGGIPGGRILQLGGQLEQLMFLKYSRDDEREADQLGVEYSAKAGYQAEDGAGFFRALKRQSAKSGQSVPEWAKTHPDPGERIQNIKAEAEKWKQKGYEENETNTATLMRHIDDMVYGDNPRQGFTRNGRFYHPELAFKFPYPESWRLQNTPSAVQMVNKDGNALIVFQIDPKNDSPRASVNEFTNQKGVQAGRGQGTSYNGLNGYESTATGKTQQGAKVAFYLYSVEYDGNIYRFVSYTLAQKFDNYQRVFTQTANGFDALHDRDILNIKPARLHVYRANRTASFESFLPRNMPLDIKKEDVAIANQVELDETIQKGDWIKIPRQ